MWNRIKCNKSSLTLFFVDKRWQSINIYSSSSISSNSRNNNNRTIFPKSNRNENGWLLFECWFKQVNAFGLSTKHIEYFIGSSIQWANWLRFWLKWRLLLVFKYYLYADFDAEMIRFQFFSSLSTLGLTKVRHPGFSSVPW